jgi:hypothetical protein
MSGLASASALDKGSARYPAELLVVEELLVDVVNPEVNMSEFGFSKGCELLEMFGGVRVPLVRLLADVRRVLNSRPRNRRSTVPTTATPTIAANGKNSIRLVEAPESMSTQSF